LRAKGTGKKKKKELRRPRFICGSARRKGEGLCACPLELEGEKSHPSTCSSRLAGKREEGRSALPAIAREEMKKKPRRLEQLGLGRVEEDSDEPEKSEKKKTLGEKHL